MEEPENNIVAKEEQPAAKEKKDRFLPMSILIAALVIGGSILFATLYRPSSAEPAIIQNAANNPATTTVQGIMALGPRDAILGSPNASVTLIEYGDYQCPYCGLFFSQTESQIIQKYVTTGKIKMVFRDFPFLGAESTASAEAAQCAEDQNKLWPYHDALYQAKVGDVAKGGSEDDGFFTRTLFLSIAQRLNLDVPTFTSCIDNNKDASVLTTSLASATAAGVNSTPTFFVNGTQILGAQPYAQFQQVIDAALAGH